MDRVRSMPARPALWLLPWLFLGFALAAAGPADSKEPTPNQTSPTESEAPAEQPATPARQEDESPRDGVELRYRVYATEETALEEANLEAIAQQVHDWVRTHDAYQVRIGIGDDDTLIVQAPGASAIEVLEIKSLIGAQRGLSFHLIPNADEYDRTTLEGEWQRYELGQGEEPAFRVLESFPGAGRYPGEPFPPTVVTWTGERSLRDADLDDASLVDDGTGAPALGFRLSESAGEKFGDLTEAALGRQLVIALNDQVIQIATIESRVEREIRVIGSFSTAEVQAMVASLTSTQFPVRLQLVHEGPIERLLPEPIQLTPGQILGSLVVGVVLVLFMLILIVSRASRGRASPVPDPAT